MGDEIFYTDKRGGRDHECVSLGCDHERVLAGRTPIQVYRDFVAEFADHCRRENLWGAARRHVMQALCVRVSRGAGPPTQLEAESPWQCKAPRV